MDEEEPQFSVDPGGPTVVRENTPNSYSPPFMTPAVPAPSSPPVNPAEGHLAAGGVPQHLEGIRPGRGGLSRNPARAADQLRARRELAARFEIVEDGYHGDRLPNQITQAEFERVAREYSDIRTGHSSLRFDTRSLGRERAAEFRTGVMDDIGDLMQTQSGRELIHALASDRRHHTNLRHVSQDTPDPRRPGDRPSNRPHEREPRGRDWAQQQRIHDAGADPRRGINTILHLDPNQNVSLSNGEQVRSDIVMMHEMNHALQHQRGTADHRTFEPEPGVTRRRLEHQAVGLAEYANDPMTENRYREERLRLGQHGRGLPGDELIVPRTDYHGPAPGSLDLPPLPPIG